MTGAARILLFVLLVAQALASATLCGGSDLTVGVRSPAAPAHGVAEVHAHGHGSDAMPCHAQAPTLDLRAVCPCGCSEGQAVASAPLGIGPALVSQPPALYPVLRGDGDRFAASALPSAPLRAIDHVPLLG